MMDIEDSGDIFTILSRSDPLLIIFSHIFFLKNAECNIESNSTIIFPIRCLGLKLRFFENKRGKICVYVCIFLFFRKDFLI